MKKLLSILMVTTIFLWAGTLLAGEPVVVDQTGTDFQNYWYIGTWGKQITMDDAGKVHIAYCKTWCTESDTGYQVMYANVTDGTKLEIPSQEPDKPIQPGVVYIGGGKNGTPIYLYYGVGSRMYAYGPAMHLQAMAKVSDDGTAIVPLGVQMDKNYYHDPHYANPIAMEVDEVGGIAHCILTNPGGREVAYWNFDGTNVGEIINVINSDPANDVPGKQIPGRFTRRQTKGADLTVNSDGSEVTIATLHNRCNIYLHKGAFGGEIWADDFFFGLDDGSVVALFDTTGTEFGTNIPNNDPKPYTEVQVVYDTEDNLHVVWDATYVDVTFDTSKFCAPGVVDDWWSQHGNTAGDMEAVFYDGTEHPKPQLQYWSEVTGTHSLLAECTYPLPGEMYKWYTYGVIDTATGEIGITYAGVWGDYVNDGPIGNIELVVNKTAEEGEPTLVCVWEEMQGEVLEYVDAEETFSNPYYAYCQDLMVSVMNGGTWSKPMNITATDDKDETTVSVYNDVINNKIHMMYYEDTYAGRDRVMIYCDDYADMFVAYTGHQGFSVPIRKPATEQVNVIYREVDLAGEKYEVPQDAMTKIARAANPPAIDGKLDAIWYNATERREYKLQAGAEQIFSWHDGALSWRALYDDAYLYMFVRVIDDTLIRDGSGNYQDDGVEIWLDGDNSKGTSYDGVNDFGFSLAYDPATVVEPIKATGMGLAADLSGIMQGAALTGDGYDVEVGIPLELIGVSPTAGYQFGLEVDYNDDDNGGDSRETKIKYFSWQDDSWTNPSTMGTVELEARSIVMELGIHQTDTAPVIDGMMDEMWLNFPMITSNNFPSVSGGTNSLAGGWTDASYTFRAAWDATNLYLYIAVNDETWVRDSGDAWYNDDAIELYIDADNSKDSSYGANDWGFHWSYNEGTVVEPTKVSGMATDRDFSFVQYGAVFTTTGLALELAIPLDTLMINPEVGQLIGFELDYDDDDDGTNRDTKVKYFTTADDSWQWPNTLGTAQLLGAEITKVDEEAAVVDEYRLDQNYPNPFNPTTTISYSIQKNDLVTLTVFNMLGQKVKTLVNAHQKAGAYTIHWDGTDNRGINVAGGMYFYQIKSGSFAKTNKMLLLK